MSQLAQEERLSYTVSEAARLIGISDASLYKQVRAGKVGHVKVGSRTLIPASILRVLLAGGQGQQ